MEITRSSTNPVRLPGVPSKPLDNPQRSKPVAPADIENARKLDAILRCISRPTRAARKGAFPQLTAQFDDDLRNGGDLGRQLLFIAATIHVAADERRTAEYLLRHRYELIASQRSALSLLLAARCAAEMDVRRVRQIEIPSALPALATIAAENPMSRSDDQSVGEVVLEFFGSAVGGFPAAPVTRTRLLDAVAVALELSHRHTLNGGAKPSFVAMRSDARKGSRLVTSLQAEFGNPTVARGLARLLVGSDRSPFEASLLWWTAEHCSTPDAVPAPIKARWIRDLSIADRAIRRDELRQAVQREFKGTYMGVSGESYETRHLGFGT